MLNRFSFLGMDIIESPVRYEPVLKLNKDVPVTDEFRKEMDAWLLEMFGQRDVSLVPKGFAYMFQVGIVMRPEQIAMVCNCAC